MKVKQNANDTVKFRENIFCFMTDTNFPQKTVWDFQKCLNSIDLFIKHVRHTNI